MATYLHALSSGQRVSAPRRFLRCFPGSGMFNSKRFSRPRACAWSTTRTSRRERSGSLKIFFEDIRRLLLMLILGALLPTAFAGQSVKGGIPAEESSNAGYTQEIIQKGGKHVLEILAYCSDRNPGVSAMRLAWPVTRRDLDKQSLELTIYKNGFERGLFTRLPAIERNAKFAVPRQYRQGKSDSVPKQFIAMFPGVAKIDFLRISKLSFFP